MYSMLLGSCVGFGIVSIALQVLFLYFDYSDAKEIKHTLCDRLHIMMLSILLISVVAVQINDLGKDIEYIKKNFKNTIEDYKEDLDKDQMIEIIIEVNK